MSDTDKTKPVWVKLMQNPQVRFEHHNHRSGTCDFDIRKQPWSDRSQCNYYCRYYSRSGRVMYGRASKCEQSYRAEANGSARTRLRNAMSDLRKLDIDAIDEYDIPIVRHRHSALGDCD